MMIDMFQQYSRMDTDFQSMKQTIHQEAGAYMREWRERRGYSVRQFAPMLGITPSYLSKIERGKELLSPCLALKFYNLDYTFHCQNCGTTKGLKNRGNVGQGERVFCDACWREQRGLWQAYPPDNPALMTPVEVTYYCDGCREKCQGLESPSVTAWCELDDPRWIRLKENLDESKLCWVCASERASKFPPEVCNGETGWCDGCETHVPIYKLSYAESEDSYLCNDCWNGYERTVK